MALKFRIKGTEEVLTPRLTDQGIIVLCSPAMLDAFYIDDYFHFSYKNPVPELEFSVKEGEWVSFEYIKDWGTQG